MRKKILNLSLALLIILSLFGCKQKNTVDTTPIQELEKEAMDSSLREEYLRNKAINEDYVGKIIIGNLINLPFVQAKNVYNSKGEYYTFYDINGNQIKEENKDFGCDDFACTGNDVYLWTDWETGQYDKMNKGGSIFMDYRNLLEDQNIIIYGHHFSPPFNPERDRAFTPLELLMEKENYEENKYITIVLDNEIREYEIAYVYEYSLLEEDDPQYYRTNYSVTNDGEYDEGYYEKYISQIKEKAYYETGVKIPEGSNTLTIQTCYSNRTDYRLIIVAKELERTYYEDHVEN